MSDQAPRSRDVFISYSKKDKEWADAACAALEARGRKCWIAPRDIRPATEYGAAIIAGIKACKMMVLILSANANASPHVRREVERAIDRRMPVLTFRIEDVSLEDALEYALGNTQWLDGFGPPRGRRLEELVDAVEPLIGREPASPDGGRPPVEPPGEVSEDWSLAAPDSQPPRLGSRNRRIGVIAAAYASLLLFGIIYYVATNRKAPPTDLKGKSLPTDIPKPREPLTTTQTEAPPPSVVDKTLIINTLGMTMKLIPAGKFEMGSDATDPLAAADEKVDGRKHPVEITRPFYLGTTEVTVGQFRRFAEAAGYRTEAEKDGTGFGWNEATGMFEQDSKYTWKSSGFEQEDDHPVVLASWNDAMALCEWLSKKEAATYRLPTEAEWEYACRSGQTTRYSSGDDPESLATVGNVADGTLKEKYPTFKTIQNKDLFVFTAPAGRFHPNEFGLFDMHGNVWEWCADWYDSKPGAAVDPRGPSKGSLRVIRGGGWGSTAENCRAAHRFKYAPTGTISFLGLRPGRDR